MSKRKNKNKNTTANEMSKKKKILSKIILGLLLLSFITPGLLKLPELFKNKELKHSIKIDLKAKIHNISEYEGKSLLSNKNTIIIDVRTPQENKELRFKNSVLMPNKYPRLTSNQVWSIERGFTKVIIYTLDGYYFISLTDLDLHK